MRDIQIIPGDTPAVTLLEDGYLPARPASYYDALPPLSLRLWCHKNARYGIPTTELVLWLREQIGTSKAIEIGAGAGDLCRLVGIPGTDSHIQADPHMALYYNLTGQPTITYGPWVQKLEALEAIRQHDPQVVIASWVTQLWREGDPPTLGACIAGVDEEAILSTGVTYILIGNYGPHGDKRIMRHRHQELAPTWLRSRAKDPTKDRIWIWQP